MTAEPEPIGAITSLGQIEALANPVRVRILRLAAQPVTVAELAERLGVPPTRLYYHVNLLVDQEMLAQVDERKSGARIEKVYRRTAADYRLGTSLIENIGDPRKAAEAAVAVLLDPARAECEDFFVATVQKSGASGEVGRTVVRLGEDDVSRFAQRLQALMQEIRAASDPEGGRTYSCTIAFVPSGER